MIWYFNADILLTYEYVWKLSLINCPTHFPNPQRYSFYSMTEIMANTTYMVSGTKNGMAVSHHTGTTNGLPPYRS